MIDVKLKVPKHYSSGICSEDCKDCSLLGFEYCSEFMKFLKTENKIF